MRPAGFQPDDASDAGQDARVPHSQDGCVPPESALLPIERALREQSTLLMVDNMESILLPPYIETPEALSKERNDGILPNDGISKGIFIPSFGQIPSFRPPPTVRNR